jgi:hypothetical protein
MVFFNVSPDPNGSLQFRVSDRWWYFLAATIPTTLLVFAVWIVWQKIRFQNHRKDYDFTEDADRFLLSEEAAPREDGEEIINAAKEATHGNIFRRKIFRKGKVFVLLSPR